MLPVRDGSGKVERRKFMEHQSPMLIAYDGSENARHALAQAGAFFGRDRPTIVLYVWEPAELAAAHRGAAGLSATPTEEGAYATAEETAALVAAEGVEIARAAGLDAQARTIQAGLNPIWETIVDAADDVAASVIVLGSRGLRGLRTLMLGSVAHQVVHHAHQSVLIVPAPGLVDVRRQMARERRTAEGTSQGAD
jgi:nucleotide-binding universal stress UspA family protein